MTPPKASTRSRRTYSQHGLTTLRHALSDAWEHMMSRRFKLGRVLFAWREDLVADLGGQDAISTQQVAVIDLATKTKLLLDSIDAWLLTQPSLVNKRNRSLIPVVRERQQLADALARYLGQLGLERKAKPRKSLASYVVEKYGSEKNGDDEKAARPKREPVKREPVKRTPVILDTSAPVIVDIPARPDEATS